MGFRSPATERVVTDWSLSVCPVSGAGDVFDDDVEMTAPDDGDDVSTLAKLNQLVGHVSFPRGVAKLDGA